MGLLIQPRTTLSLEIVPIEHRVKFAELHIIPSEILGELDEYSISDVFDRITTMDAVIKDLKADGLYRPDLLYRMFHVKQLEIVLDTGTDRTGYTSDYNTPKDGISQQDKTFLARERDFHVFSHLIGDYKEEGEFGISVLSSDGVEFVKDAPLGYAIYRPEFRDKKRDLLIGVYRIILHPNMS